MKSKKQIKIPDHTGKRETRLLAFVWNCGFSAETFLMRKSLRCGGNPPPEVWMILKTRHSTMWNV